jgi:predicted Zn-dependent protease
LALAFAALVNFALVASFVWTELFPAAVRKSVWLAVAAVWVGSAVAARWRDTTAGGNDDTTRPGDPFGDAAEQYLKGNWFEAECLLADLLRRDPRDVDAGLMLATLYRHTGRLDEASNQLDHLERLDEAAKWALEISRERRLLAAVQQEPSDDPVEATQGE